jgi:hypothetical protein
MQKLILLSLIILFSSSCQKSQVEKSPSLDHIDQSVTDGTVLDPATGLPVGALTFDAQLQLYNFNSEQQDKMERAVAIIKLVVATVEFREKVLNHSYNGQKTFVDNAGYTNAQVYQKILEGAESLQPTRDNTLNAEIELYYAATNIVGYTYPSSKRIWINTKYFTNYTDAGVAHNLFHEWMHKLGFNHETSWSESRDYSVPYAVGNIIGLIGKDFL